MPLADHLRELRSRLLKSGIAIGLGMIAGWIWYPQLFAWLSRPFNDVVAEARADGRTITLALTGVADPFVLQLQVAAVAGLIVSSPIWLYQLWRFVTPGLHRHERRWALGFAAVATPLFLIGVGLAYLVLPYGLQILFGFTPEGVENIVPILVLVALAVGVCLLNDRRRARRRPEIDYSQFDDDEASPLPGT